MIKIEPIAYGIVTVIRDSEYKFLILFQDKEFKNWSFPKGKNEGEETPIETAMRELKEETCITDIDILDFPLIEDSYEIEKEDGNILRINKYFIGIVKNTSVKMQEGEIYDYKWATYQEAINTFVFKKEERVKVLQQAQKYLEEYDARK